MTSNQYWDARPDAERQVWRNRETERWGTAASKAFASKSFHIEVQDGCMLDEVVPHREQSYGLTTGWDGLVLA